MCVTCVMYLKIVQKQHVCVMCIICVMYGTRFQSGVHLISAKMNGSTRIVGVTFPEKSDQWGLRDNFLKTLREFKLTYDQIRTGDIKCLNLCGDAAPVIVRVENIGV